LYEDVIQRRAIDDDPEWFDDVDDIMIRELQRLAKETWETGGEGDDFIT